MNKRMGIVADIKPLVVKALKELYEQDPIAPESYRDGFQQADLTINQTKPEFEGDYTLVLFSFVKQLKKSPEQLGKEIGDYLVKNNADLFVSYYLIKGFLNLVITESYWINFLASSYTDKQIGHQPANQHRVIVEYSSPNTNKPLHLGHLRNNFLGWSVAEILKTTGNTVFKTAIMNDRGIHICKSMVAWQLFGEGKTPESTGIKGDHFVGDYYVMFGEEHKKQIQILLADGMDKEAAEKNAPIMLAAQKMLLDWENGDPEVMTLWQRMNSWVYEGFNETYKKSAVILTKIILKAKLIY